MHKAPGMTTLALALALSPLVTLSPMVAASARADPVRQQVQAADAARLALLGARRQAAERLRAAEALAARLAEARVQAAAQLRGLETQTADAATAMDALAQRRAAAQTRVAATAAALAPLLPLTLRLSLYPAETLLVVPAPAEDALRGLLVLKGMARHLEVEAEALRAEEADIARLSAQITAQEVRLAEAQSAQAAKAAVLDRQITEARAQGQDAEDVVADTDRRAAAQAAQADSLRAALAGLEASRKQAEARAQADAALAERAREVGAAADAHRRQAAFATAPGPGLGEPRGQLGAPVAGAVVRAFGEAGDGGPASGVSYQAPPAARVVAPCAGRVVFAGPFRSYGAMVILDCGGGYHFVLAGLDRLDAPVGAKVQPGEPVGVMPSWDPRTPGSRPALYVELRRAGLPVNPAPFLRGRS